MRALQARDATARALSSHDLALATTVMLQVQSTVSSLVQLFWGTKVSSLARQCGLWSCERGRRLLEKAAGVPGVGLRTSDEVGEMYRDCIECERKALAATGPAGRGHAGEDAG